MNDGNFIYASYIATTPNQLWQALTDPQLMRQYWLGAKADTPAHENISDWVPGSRWEHRRVDTGVVDMVGKVLECDPPRRLAFTWARPQDVDAEAKHSRVCFDIEPQSARLVRLAVVHDGLKADLKMLPGISEGWPQILSHLKTFLETGRAMPRD